MLDWKMRKTAEKVEKGSRSGPLYTIRAPRAGDPGWIVQRHGALYAQEQGYDMRFEALVARLVGEFFERNLQPKTGKTGERCWIAEKDGKNIGCVFVFRKYARVAKLRMLLVEPSARGMGVGSRLIEECIRFARSSGYRKMTLWTHKSLREARRLYRRAGFRLVRAAPNPSFGKKLVDEFWELEL